MLGYELIHLPTFVLILSNNLRGLFNPKPYLLKNSSDTI